VKRRVRKEEEKKSLMLLGAFISFHSSHSVNEESIQRLYLLFQETLLEALHLAENKAG
jgi:hypothetical protein